MNFAVETERCAFGTALIAGLEEILWHECVDLVVLYPVQNGRAPNFWTSVGYEYPGEKSYLPDEELIDKKDGGSLLPEGCNGKPLPRFEKQIRRPYDPFKGRSARSVSRQPSEKDNCNFSDE